MWKLLNGAEYFVYSTCILCMLGQREMLHVVYACIREGVIIDAENQGGIMQRLGAIGQARRHQRYGCYPLEAARPKETTCTGRYTGTTQFHF